MPYPETPKDFEVTVQIRNNRLKARRLELGFETQADFARAAGISVSTYCALETMRESPLRKDGGWKEIAIRLAEFHGCSFDDLFPSAVLEVQKNKGAFQASLSDMQSFLSAFSGKSMQSGEARFFEKEKLLEFKRVFGTLRPIEREVLKLRFGLDGEEEHTLEAIGGLIGGRFRERVRQIEAKALRKLRHPSRSRRLRPYHEDSILFRGVEEEKRLTEADE